MGVDPGGVLGARTGGLPGVKAVSRLCTAHGAGRLGPG